MEARRVPAGCERCLVAGKVGITTCVDFVYVGVGRVMRKASVVFAALGTVKQVLEQWICFKCQIPNVQRPLMIGNYGVPIVGK
jgi:hypothetical protein